MAASSASLLIGAQQAYAACPLCGATGSVTGKWSVEDTTTTAPGEFQASLEWTALYEPTEATAESREAWHLTELSGHLLDTQSGAACDAQLEPGPHENEVFQSLDAPYLIRNLNSSGEITGWTMSFAIPLELGIFKTKEGGGEGKGFCYGNFTGGTADAWETSDSRWSALLHGPGGADTCHLTNGGSVSTLLYPPESSYSYPDECEYVGEVPPTKQIDGRETVNATLTATASLSTPGVVSPFATGPTPGLGAPPTTPYGPRLRPGSALRRQQAIDEGRKLLADAKRVCTFYVVQELGLSFGPALATLISSASPLLGQCADDITGALKQVQIYDNDPPDLNTGAVQLPASAAKPLPRRCQHGKKGALCRALRPFALRAEATAMRVAAVEDALTTTSNRMGTAAAAGDTTNTELQEAAFDALDGELAPDLDAQNAAEGELAKELRRKHVGFTFNQSTVSKGLASILEQAAADGTSQGELETIAGDELAPRAFKYAATLGPVSTREPMELWHSMTVPGLQAIYFSLKSRGEIPPKQQPALKSDLSAAVQAATASIRVTRLKAFVKTAEAVQTHAGTLLRYAAEPLA